MLESIMDSIRWDQLALMLGIQAVIVCVYLAVLRPMARNAERELAAARRRSATTDAILSLSRAASALYMPVASGLSEPLAPRLESFRQGLAGAPDEPALQRSGAELIAAAQAYEHACNRADGDALDAERLRLFAAAAAFEARLFASWRVDPE